MADNGTDLSECESEPIHLIGSIQPHGFLLALEGSDLIIEHCSANTATLLGIQPQQLLGTKLEGLFGVACCQLIKEALAGNNLKAICPLTITPVGQTPAPTFLATLHRSDNLLILEAEPLDASRPKGANSPSHELTSTFPSLFSAGDIPQLLSRTATEIQRISDLDRVLIYQFDEDWHGRVVAEERRDFMKSYMNQHFPAGDIPRQARELYVKNWIRVLVDVNATASPIIPQYNKSTGKPIDLSFSILRSMSPVHIEYLKNMGENASMSVSVIREGKLWALIACHHKRPKMVDAKTRVILEFLAQLLSLLVGRLEQADHMQHKMTLKKIQERLLRRAAHEIDMSATLSAATDDMLEVAGARGFALYYEGNLIRGGLTPSPKALAKLHQWLNTTQDSAVVYTHKLSTIFPEAASYGEIASGLLAVPICRQGGTWLVWFRPETVQEVEWAGRPDTLDSSRADNLHLHPRKSFELWKERVVGTADRWKQCEIDSAIEVSIALRDMELAKLQRQQQLDKELSKEREQFLQQRQDWLATLAHDLKTPAIGAQRLLELLINGAVGQVPANQQELLASLQNSNSEQLARIDKLLEVFSFETSTRSLNIISTALEPILTNCITTVTAFAQSRNIEIINDGATPDAYVMTDAGALKRIVLGILDNAIKFSDGGGQITLHWESVANKVHLHIQDHGPGIPEADQKQLFERLWQGGQGKYHVGVGLGLYLCHKIAVAMGSEISCSSKIGAGSTFTVTLPVATLTEANTAKLNSTLL